MSILYNTEYREINVNYLLKSLSEYKVLFLTITLSITLFTSYYVSTIEPIYKSEALLKIGYYNELNASDGRFLTKPLDSASDLVSKLSFIFHRQTSVNGWIEQIQVENDDRSNEQEYVSIESRGASPEESSQAIENLVDYVRTQHTITLNSKRELLKITLEIINAELDAIGIKQNNILSNNDYHNQNEFSTLFNNIKLLTLMDKDLDISYISEQMRKKQVIEHFLSNEDSFNSSLVSEIYSPKNPISPNKNLIITLSFLIGIILSIGTIFTIKLLPSDELD
jgi:hypothetical protein